MRVSNKNQEFSDKELLVELTLKDNKSARRVRQLGGIGIIEAVSLYKATGCRNLVDFLNWTIDTLNYHNLEAVVASFHTCIVSWERTSKFTALLLALYKFEGFNLYEKSKDSKFSIN